MKQARFEKLHAGVWQEFREYLDRLEDNRIRFKRRQPFNHAPRFIELYRQVCSHLALSESRGYSPALTRELHNLVLRGHQQISRESTPLHLRIYRFLWIDFPATLRAEWQLFWWMSLLFYGTTFGIGLAVYWHPSLGITLLGEGAIQQFSDMYNPANGVVGSFRDADSDLAMFGFYIANNIGVGFRTFATGMFLGIGSILSTFYNGMHGGVVGGYLTQLGYTETFYSFVCSHAPWELTAIVISAVAGSRVGFSLIAPGRLSRRDALILAGSRAATLMWGVVVMLVIAAFFEAFWSSHASVPTYLKYTVSAINTLLVTFYFMRMGRSDGTD